MLEELLKSLDWNEMHKQRLKRYEMMLKTTKHSVKRKKIIRHIEWLKQNIR